MLPKKERLTDGAEIRAILKRKQLSYSTPLLRLVASANNRKRSRWVIMVGKTVGNAVVRNRLRRIIVAEIGAFRHKTKKNMDIVLMIKCSFPSAEGRSSLEGLITRAGLL